MSEEQRKPAPNLHLPLAWFLALLVSAVLFYGSIKAGIAGDCKPYEHDGQCGLSSFLGLVYGAVSAGVILLGMAVLTVTVLVRRRKAKRNLA